MKNNRDKFHLLTSSNDKLKVYVNDDVIKSTKCANLLGAMIDNKSFGNVQKTL